jgi:hypothetical protein
MKTENFDVQVLIYHLQGSCDTLNSAIDTLFPGMSEDDLTEDDHNEIDNQIFLCETCGWWCEICEQDLDGNCEDCSTENEDEDEYY